MKHVSYLKYLMRHKYFVLVAGLRTKAPLWRLLIHDWSKFMPCEWLPYSTYFFGNRTEGSKDDFKRAWLHHQHRNPHHWQHWVLRNDDGSTTALRMPSHFVQEMVADWAGAGRGITGHWEVEQWYEDNKSKMDLHPWTRFAVEMLLMTRFADLRTKNLLLTVPNRTIE